MSESESDALPLGDTPRFSTLGIISHRKRFVNTYFKLFLKKYSFFRKIGFFYFTKYVFCDTIHKSILYLPVAQLDSASDSDSEGQRFESVRVGQNKARGQGPPCFVFVYSYGQEKCYATRSVCKSSESVRVGQVKARELSLAFRFILFRLRLSPRKARA